VQGGKGCVSAPVSTGREVGCSLQSLADAPAASPAGAKILG